MVVISQPVLTDEQIGGYGLPGYGGASGGYHLILLNETQGKTVVTVFMEHGSVAARGADADTITDEAALAPWQTPDMVPEWHRKWRDDFIPLIKQRVADRA